MLRSLLPGEHVENSRRVHHSCDAAQASALAISACPWAPPNSVCVFGFRSFEIGHSRLAMAFETRHASAD